MSSREYHVGCTHVSERPIRMKANGQDALELAELKFPVFPLHTWNVDHCDCNDPACGMLDEYGEMIGSPAKHPRTKHGFKDGSTAVEDIVRWWGMWPAANIGVRTGAEAGVVVLDVDPRNGGIESWLALKEANGYEHQGPACITGGGGMHFWFAHPGGTILSRSGQIGAGLDVKADGGYVVAPPSVHKTGAAYAWIEGYAPWDRELPGIPDWLLLLMQTPVGQDKFDPTGIADKITRGGRNSALLSLAGSMRRRNMGETAIFNALMAENAEKCDPPLDTREVARIAKSVGRYESASPDPPLIVDTGKRAKSGPERRAEAYVPVPGTFADLKHKQLPPTAWAVERFLPQGVAMLAGAAKLGKSWLVLNLQFAIATEELAFGYLLTIVGDCLYLALEDGENRLQGRTRSLFPNGEWPARAWYEVKWPRIDEGGREALEAWLGQHPDARLVVIDTFALFKPLDTGKNSKDIYAADYASVRAVKAIADEYGVCILLVTHLNKGDHEDWVNGMTGSTGLSGSADTLLNMARPDGFGRGVSVKNEATLRLTGRDVEEQAWACKRDDYGWWRIEGDAYEAVELRSSNETVKYMQMLWRDGYPEVTATLLRTMSNSTKATANRNLGRTAAAGLIQRISQGTYALLESDRVQPIVRQFGQ